MKYLNKFLQHLNESQDITDLSKEELEDMLQPIKDLGIEYNIGTPRIITEGDYESYTSMNIIFKNSFKMNLDDYPQMIIDSKFWDFLDELITFKNRLESTQVSINTNWKNHIVVSFVQKSKVEGGVFELEKLYNQMGRRMNASKSDFSNNMSRRLYKDELKIVVTCGGFREAAYTDRKWNGLFRGIDFSKFNVEKNITDDRWGDKQAEITITLK